MSQKYLFSLIDKMEASRHALTVVGDKAITYGELVQKSKRIAAGFAEEGLKPGDKVFLLAELSDETLACIIALLRVGGIPVIADPGTGKAVLQARIDESGAKWIIVSPALYAMRNHPLVQRLVRKRRPDLPHLFGVSLPSKKILATSKKIPGLITIETLLQPEPVDTKDLPVDTTMIVFTSGTTGAPKGVVHTHKSLQASVEAMGQIINHDEPVLYTHQPYFVLLGIVLGAHVVYDSRKISPKAFVENSKMYSPTITFGPPGEFIPIINYLAHREEQFPQCYSQVMFGSAPITQSFLKKFKAIAGNVAATCMYGMTEAIPICTIDMDKKLAWKGDGDILGPVLNGITSKIVDQVLHVRGSRVIASYLNKPAHEWVSTGDVVRKDGDNIVLMGRKKDMILRRSYNIYPSLFEPIISSIPGVQACALVGVYSDSLEDERVILIVEAEPRKTLHPQRLMERLKGGKYSIDANALPDEIVIATLPRSGRQLKIDKAALRKQFT